MQAEKDIIDTIQLINSGNIGPITFYKLCQSFGSAAQALDNLPAKSKIFPRSQAVRELELAKNLGIRILTCQDSDYPENLRSVEDAPPLLYVKGNPGCLNSPLSLSIVGARNASLPGRKLASKIAYDLTEEGIMIISGMARGIDTAAHKGAMYACNQQGRTIAVLGTGVDIAYPSENLKLYEQIAENGAVISEFPLGTEPTANNFPRRNRIVSALSNGTLVVEATLRSGSLITARLAMEQGRDVFAVPGFPADGRSSGPNKLIKDGAALVENAEDILNIFNYTNHCQIKKLSRPVQKDLFAKSLDKELKTADIPVAIPPLTATEKVDIRDYLSPGGVYVDEIIRDSGLDSATVSLQLLELEMAGEIEHQVGNKVALIK
mgnify:CR=1 FL=1